MVSRLVGDSALEPARSVRSSRSFLYLIRKVVGNLSSDRKPDANNVFILGIFTRQCWFGALFAIELTPYWVTRVWAVYLN